MLQPVKVSKYIFLIFASLTIINKLVEYVCQELKSKFNRTGNKYNN